MLTLNIRYLFERMIKESAKTNYFVQEWAKSLSSTKLTKDQIVIMLSNIDNMKTLKEMSDYFYDSDGQRYIAYQPSDDSFISDKNKNDIVSKIADYLFKCVCN